MSLTMCKNLDDIAQIVSRVKYKDCTFTPVLDENNPLQWKIHMYVEDIYMQL
jgi:uncharacterized protein YdcH (DUF465 family)